MGRALFIRGRIASMATGTGNRVRGVHGRVCFMTRDAFPRLFARNRLRNYGRLSPPHRIKGLDRALGGSSLLIEGDHGHWRFIGRNRHESGGAENDSADQTKSQASGAQKLWAILHRRRSIPVRVLRRKNWGGTSCKKFPPNPTSSITGFFSPGNAYLYRTMIRASVEVGILPPWGFFRTKSTRAEVTP